MNFKIIKLMVFYCYDLIKMVNKFLLSCLYLLLYGCQSSVNADSMLPNNFYQISSNIFRSEQPNSRQMKYLDKLGFKTVVNLRKRHSDKAEIADTNISQVWLKMRAGKITDKQIIEILRAIHLSPKPLLIHCWHGSDRTGVVVAMYRLVFQNWTKSQAITELMKPEFGHHYNFYPNIVKYLENVDVENIRTAVYQY